jgi:hypothetical protein
MHGHQCCPRARARSTGVPGGALFLSGWPGGQRLVWSESSRCSVPAKTQTQQKRDCLWLRRAGRTQRADCCSLFRQFHERLRFSVTPP